MTSQRVLRVSLLVLLGLVMVVPLYLLVINAFKSQQDIVSGPFAITSLSLQYLARAITSPEFNVIRAYGITAAFAVAVNVLCIAVTGPASYVLARGRMGRHRATFFVLLAGLFIPGQVLVIPVIYVLKTLGLMGTVPGFLLFETTLMIPVSMFLFVAYIQSIPRELDEAAKIDGAGTGRTFWTVIFPLMRPAVATTVILHTIGVWSDFVNPQIILGPYSGIYTVTTGIYAAISKYQTDYTLVFPDMLLAVTPMLIFFVFMQRNIVSGLTSGALKG